MIGLSALAYQRIGQENRSATEAIQLADDTRVQSAVAAVYGPAQLEQTALEGLAAIDTLGVPRDLVVTISGADFEGIYNTNRIELDQSLDELAAVETERVPSTAGLAEALGFIRGELNVQRTLSEASRAELEGIGEVFERLDNILAETLIGAESSATTSSASADTSGVRSELEALNRVLVGAGARGASMLSGLLDHSPETTLEIIEADARLELAIESFVAMLADDELLRFEEVMQSIDPLPQEFVSLDDRVSIAAAIDPTYIRTAAEAMLNQFAFVAALEKYSNEFHDAAVVSLDNEAVAAQSAAMRTTLAVVATIAVSLLVLFTLTVSMLRPLKRLTKRAATISDGGFDVEPLPLHGPKDVRTLTNTMNDMMATLHQVDHDISTLANGAYSDLRSELPGSIGVSLRGSIQRLEDTNRELLASQQLASAIVEQAADAIWTVDAKGIIATANEASVSLTGVPASTQIGQSLRLYLPANDGEVTIEDATGERARLLIASSDINSGSEPLTAVIARDISERLRYEERLAYQAHHDALTGLPNRFAILGELGVRPLGEAVAILFLDLDGFKSVNDTQGHLAGDRLLTEVGSRLSVHVRPGDFVGRLGGDEFVVIMNNYDRESDVVAFGNRLIQEVEQPFTDGDNIFALSASIGVASFENGLEAIGLTPLDGIRCADNAVYEAKRRGRGRVEMFDAHLQETIVKNAEIEIALRQAVRNDELEIHLQPVLDMPSGTFTSAEALVRWNRPGHGMVSPGAFIPIAERSSLIFEIGRLVMMKACETLREWADDEALCKLKIAVNIAGSHLLDGNLIDDLDSTILLTGANPTLLELELTETQLMEDIERARRVLEEIRERGISVAIDDFGTGYSSMAYLRQLPIDTLKIDRSFVSSITEENFDSTVIDALLTIGHALGLSIVAEGIECEEQLAYLASQGCDRAQGFHLARPVPIADAEIVMRSNHQARWNELVEI